jgi:hypothetical protein
MFPKRSDPGGEEDKLNSTVRRLLASDAPLTEKRCPDQRHGYGLAAMLLWPRQL